MKNSKRLMLVACLVSVGLFAYHGNAVEYVNQLSRHTVSKLLKIYKANVNPGESKLKEKELIGIGHVCSPRFPNG